MSLGISEPVVDVPKVRECPLCRLGALSGREMGPDSKTQSPGELCHTRLQDTNSLSQTKAACSYLLIHTHTHVLTHTLVTIEKGGYNHTHVNIMQIDAY